MIPIATKSQESYFLEEERQKQYVYAYLDQAIEAASDTPVPTPSSYDKNSTGAEASGYYASLLKIQSNAELARRLYDKAYFAHLEIQDLTDGEDGPMHAMLSDNPALDEIVYLDDSYQQMLLPFADTPMSKALYMQYQLKNTKPFAVQSYRYQLSMIRDVQITKGVLEDVVQYFPDLTEYIPNQFVDALLLKRLEENRSNPHLGNIISTLRAQQMEVVNVALQKSFVLQGCAGSGKTQCLLHRLFYLRVSLSQRGWEHVLLISPSQLFQNYTADLMRRYRLTSVQNYTITQLYTQLLTCWDNQFSHRQYVIEPSEEYLPGEYLQAVYEASQVEGIIQNIHAALADIRQEAGALLRLEDPAALSTAELLQQVQSQLSTYESYLSPILNSAKQKAKLHHLEKQLKAIQRSEVRIHTLQEEEQALLEKRAAFAPMDTAFQEARAELQAEEADIQARRHAHITTLARFSKKMLNLDTEFAYCQTLAAYLDEILPDGEAYVAQQARLSTLSQRLQDAEAAVLEHTAGESADAYRKKLEKSLSDKKASIAQLTNDVLSARQAVDETNTQLSQQAGNINVLYTREQYKALEGLKHRLERLASSTFDRAIWQTLEPLKARYAVETTRRNTSSRTCRLLYKSDLLFYLHVYLAMGERKKLPDYQLICVDEGQDLHRSDYQLLRTLFPDATLNVFGDTDQALQSGVGVVNWQADTGIQTVYKLHTNYRNPASIVQFCNTALDCHMQFLGNAQQNAAVRVARNTLNIYLHTGVTLIVKDQEQLAYLCQSQSIDTRVFSLLDTHATDQPSGKIPCYTIHAAKGLEFTDVVVFPRGMTRNQKIVACTRAMQTLVFFDPDCETISKGAAP